MNRDAIGAISEGLGAAAVFVTLIYLAVQVRHAREEVRRSLSRARAEAHREALAVLSEPATLPLWVRANLAENEGVVSSPFLRHAMERWGMTREEAMRLFHALISSWQTRLELIPYVDELSPIERHEFEQVVAGLYGRPGAQRTFYELYLKSTQHPDALRYVESVIARNT